MMNRFNPAVLMAALMRGLGEIAAARPLPLAQGGGSRAFRHNRRFPTRKMIAKQRNKKKQKLGR